jgi:hypothetical protein
MANLLNKEMEDKDIRFKAFDFASETTKQLVTIATGIIALMVTFSKDVVGENYSSEKTLLFWTWGIFILSILFGVLTLMALTGTLQPKKVTVKNEGNSDSGVNNTESSEIIDLNINNFNIRIFSFLQILFFVGGLILTALFGYKSLTNNEIRSKQQEEKQQIPIIRKSILNNDSTKIYIDTLYIEKNTCR